MISLFYAIAVGVTICMYSTIDKVGVDVVDIDPITCMFYSFTLSIHFLLVFDIIINRCLLFGIVFCGGTDAIYVIETLA